MFMCDGSGAAARGLPVFLPNTEAAADANTFVCEMTGGAAANETGVGGGLTGADLVLSQNGGIPAAASGFRVLDGGSQFFTWTAAALLAMLGGSEWTMMWRLKNWGLTASTYLCRLLATDTTVGNCQIFRTNTSGNCTATGVLAGASAGSIILPGQLNGTFDGWFTIWRKDACLHAGFLAGSAPPTGWDSILPDNRQVLRGFGSMPGVTWTTLHIIGSSNGYPAMSVGTFVASKIGLQAAPL